MTENIALNKPAYQQYPFSFLQDSLGQAGNAVDGKKSNLSWEGGQCTISDNYQRTATWWVNLTSILSIHHIIVYYRTGNVEWGMNIKYFFHVRKKGETLHECHKFKNIFSFLYCDRMIVIFMNVSN